jgi:hypothetical protein
MIALLVTLLLAPEATTDVGEIATLTVRWDKGNLSIVRIERSLLPRPTRLLRYRGRFEARAVDSTHGGDKTLDFVRFDIPLMAPADSADEMTDEARALAEKLRANVTATTFVRVPLPRGATAVSVYDTATKKTVVKPLTPPPPASSSPAASPAAGGGGSTRR